MSKQLPSGSPAASDSEGGGNDGHGTVAPPPLRRKRSKKSVVLILFTLCSSANGTAWACSSRAISKTPGTHAPPLFSNRSARARVGAQGAEREVEAALL